MFCRHFRLRKRIMTVIQKRMVNLNGLGLDNSAVRRICELVNTVATFNIAEVGQIIWKSNCH